MLISDRTKKRKSPPDGGKELPSMFKVWGWLKIEGKKEHKKSFLAKASAGLLDHLDAELFAEAHALLRRFALLAEDPW